jgi:hypothetical protein
MSSSPPCISPSNLLQLHKPDTMRYSSLISFAFGVIGIAPMIWPMTQQTKSAMVYTATSAPMVVSLCHIILYHAGLSGDTNDHWCLLAGAGTGAVVGTYNFQLLGPRKRDVGEEMCDTLNL